MLSNLFEIRRPYPNGWRASRILHATDAQSWSNYNTAFTANNSVNLNWNAGLGNTVGIMRGVALGAHLTDSTAYALADGKNFIGFIMRDCTLLGPQLADHVMPNRLELPYQFEYEVSTEKADEIEAEGSGFLLLSGTGALSGTTAVETLCSFNGGLLYAAQSGDTPYYKVSGNASTGVVPLVAGTPRLRFEAIR